jgi:DnaJ homolog subfamily A member 2
MMSDYYKILGLERDVKDDDIKKAYKKMAVKHHPDKGGDEETFKEVAEAYEVLSDKEKRRLYDMGVYNRQGKQHSFVNPHDIFRQFFGGGGFSMGPVPGGSMPGGMMSVSTSTRVVGEMRVTTETRVSGNTKQETVTETNMRTGESRVQTSTTTTATPGRQSFEIFFG